MFRNRLIELANVNIHQTSSLPILTSSARSWETMCSQKR